MTRNLVLTFLIVTVLVLFVAQPVQSQYRSVSQRTTDTGFEVLLELAQSQSDFSTPIQRLTLTATYWKDNVFRFAIRDSERERWEVPHVTLPRLNSPTFSNGQVPFALQYDVFTNGFPFSLAVVRKSDSVVVFNMTKLIYNDQYIELEDSIPNDGSRSHIYGFGERVHNFRMDSTDKTYTLYAYDHGTPIDEPTYGSHPFHMQYFKNKFHGGFMLNSNAMDVTLSRDKIVYKMIGGIVDLFTYIGPSAEEVMQQHQVSVVGTPKLVPFWALGNHQCRWGYKNIAATEEVANNYERLGIPLDTVWNDIDWMDGYKVFETHPQNFPVPELQAFVDRLHKKDRHYMVILDPGIKVESGYKTYEEGLKQDVFVKSAETGGNLVGKVWPGYTVFPDFTKTSTVRWWQNEIATFLKKIPVSGLWIDMNEVASFVDGECFYHDQDRCDPRSPPPKREGFDPNNPPYRPGHSSLISHTISSDAVYNASIEYNLHTLYGFNEARVTMPILESVTGKRGFVISRSTFAGSGRYTQHWLGDNRSTWGDLFYSISGILSFQMYGIPFAGVDICGFQGDSNAELCARWVQLGAFYPFTRNHNDEQSAPQEYYQFGDSVVEVARKSLLTKYALLSYYYTLLKVAADKGGSVLRPIVFEFPEDANTDVPYLDRQFLVGSALLVNPVVEPDQRSVYSYVPGEGKERWYDFFTGHGIQCSGWCTFDAPFEKINVFMRGGHAILLHSVSEFKTQTTVQARQDGFNLVLALNNAGEAEGYTYIDDGESINPTSKIDVTYSHKKVGNKFVIASKATQTGSVSNINLRLNELSVYGVSGSVSSVRINSVSYPQFAQSDGVLKIVLSNIDVKVTNISIEYETK